MRPKMRSLAVCMLCALGWCWTSMALERLDLSKDKETRVRRFLHPLPQVLQLKGIAYQVAAEQCSLEGGSDDKGLEGKMIADFRARWKATRKQDIGSARRELHVIAGLLKSVPALDQAARRGLFDAKYLAERRNAEQAYVIATEAEDKDVAVYIAANDTPGLYYGLLTFEQLLEGLSSGATLVFPHVHVVDWPDIQYRGSWTVPQADLEAYSRWKCNYVEAWHLSIHGKTEAGGLDIEWSVAGKEKIEDAKRFGIRLFPGTGHTSRHAGNPIAKELFPNAAATKSARPQALCYSSSDAWKFMDAYIEGIARKYDFADVWLAELEGPSGACQCKKCRGRLQTQFVNEIKAILGAYEKARKINPKFRIMLGLTQGSAPHTHAILPLIPKDIPLNYYDGKVTYRATFKKYNLPPKAQEIKRQGYFMGVTNSPGQTTMVSPFLAPRYCRMLCSEAGDRGLDFMLCEFWPSPFFHDLNAEAIAEFLWNNTGRSVEEFTTAWATRKGMKDPEEVAKIIDLIEYPSRGVRNTSFQEVLPRIRDFMLGKKPVSSMILYGFETRSSSEADRALALCDEAVARAEKLKEAKLVADCRMVRYWLSLFAHCMHCLGRKADAPEVQEAKKAIVKVLSEFPQTWRAWRDQNPLTGVAASTIERRVPLLQLIWFPVLAQQMPGLSPRAREVFDDYQKQAIGMHRIQPVWRFRTDKDADASGKWPYKEIKQMPTIRSDKDGGWEKQGYADYTGQAWYIMPGFSMFPQLRKKKHVYLYINAIHGEADIRIGNSQGKQKKMLSLDGGKVEPVAFDLRPHVALGEKYVMITVRVRADGDTRGIVGPVYLVGCDKPATAADITPLLRALP